MTKCALLASLLCFPGLPGVNGEIGPRGPLGAAGLPGANGLNGDIGTTQLERKRVLSVSLSPFLQNTFFVHVFWECHSRCFI